MEELMEEIDQINSNIIYLCAVDKDNTFQINYIDLRYNDMENKFTFRINYSVLLLQSLKNHSFDYTELEKFDTKKDVIEHIFEILWKNQLCKECFTICRKQCIACHVMKCFWQHGIEKKYADSYPICTICLEPVYHSRLACGHYFHPYCICNMVNTSDSDELRCPNCRSPFTKRDKARFLSL